MEIFCVGLLLGLVVEAVRIIQKHYWPYLV